MGKVKTKVKLYQNKEKYTNIIGRINSGDYGWEGPRDAGPLLLVTGGQLCPLGALLFGRRIIDGGLAALPGDSQRSVGSLVKQPQRGRFTTILLNDGSCCSCSPCFLAVLAHRLALVRSVTFVRLGEGDLAPHRGTEDILPRIRKVASLAALCV